MPRDIIAFLSLSFIPKLIYSLPLAFPPLYTRTCIYIYNFPNRSPVSSPTLTLSFSLGCTSCIFHCIPYRRAAIIIAKSEREKTLSREIDPSRGGRENYRCTRRLCRAGIMCPVCCIGLYARAKV